MGERPIPPRIFTDSTASLPRELAGIGVIALGITFPNNDTVYKDGVDLDTSGVIEEMKKRGIPTTSAPSPGEYLEAWKQYPDEPILSIHLTSKSSETFHSAKLASDEPEVKGRVFAYDSGTISGGLALMALRAAALSQNGKTIDEIIIELDAIKKKMTVFAAIDSLEHLERGGRISKAALWFGTLIPTRPIIEFINGSFGVREKSRRAMRLSRLVGLTEAFSREHGGLEQVAVTHGGAEEDASRVMADIKAKGLFQGEILFGPCGGALVVQAGPGVVSVALVGNEIKSGDSPTYLNM